MSATLVHKTVKTALNRQSGGFLNTFTHSLQPYTGCAFGQRVPGGQGCPFCYVRKLPVSLFRNEEWGEWVEAKENIGEVLRNELRRHARNHRLQDVRIFMSSATDPYQGAEASLKLTRSCLDAMADFPPQLLVIQTRSPLVLRDIDIITKLGARVWVSMTLETNDESVRSRFTPTSPTVQSRLRAMRQLYESGIQVQAAVSPMLPNHPESFAQELVGCCTRVLVDTLFHGDGAHGRRSESLGMRQLYSDLGYADWYDPTRHEALLVALRQVHGEDQVVFSQEGFNEF